MIPHFLLALLPKAKLVGLALAAAAVIGAVLYIGHLRSVRDDLTRENGTLKAHLDQAIDVAEMNRQALERTKKDHAAAIAALEAANAGLTRRLVAATRIRTEIDHAPASDDAPLAPVLRRALDGLRHNAGDAPAARGADRAAGGAARPVDLRPGAAGSENRGP